MDLRIACFVGLALSSVTFDSTAWAGPARGYHEQACGFDLDDDGNVGESDDDCRVCDGVTTDPDWDGVDEDLIYVDCDAGQDNGTCGAPDSPCATLEHALTNRMDGPGDGAEDIVCFTGVCSPAAVRPAFGGLTDVRVVPASGSEARDFELATDPAMLVGWDRDADGEYPPYDTDDVAVMDGTGLARAITVRNSTASHFEFAHFEAREYGRVGTGGGFFAQGPSHNHLHDIELHNINREMPTPSGRIVFDFFTSQDNHYFWAKNIECEDCGGYFVRGAGGNGPQEAGPFRFQNMSLTMHPCSYGSSAACDAQPYGVVAKLWGYMRGVEFLDSVFDGDPTNRQLGNHPSHWPSGVGPTNCAQGFVIRNNTFIDTDAMTVQGYAGGFCDGPEVRPTSDVLFEHNYVLFETLGRPASAITLQPVGQVAGANVGNVTIVDNFFRSDATGGMSRCFNYAAGNTEDTPTGLLVFESNRCEGSQQQGFRMLNPNNATPHDNYEVHDNVFTETVGTFVNAGYAPSAFVSDGNLFGGDASFRWGGGAMTDFAAFQAASASNASSSACPDNSCIPTPACGDEVCDPDEDCLSCPSDCGELDDGGDGSDGGTDGGDDAGDDSDDSDGGVDETVGEGGGSTGGGTDGTGEASGDATSSDDDSALADGDRGGAGCSCRSAPGEGNGPALLVLVLACRRRAR